MIQAVLAIHFQHLLLFKICVDSTILRGLHFLCDSQEFIKNINIISNKSIIILFLLLGMEAMVRRKHYIFNRFRGLGCFFREQHA